MDRKSAYPCTNAVNRYRAMNPHPMGKDAGHLIESGWNA
jgi:hypothetical protein